MTDMQLIVPPLDDTGNQGGSSDNGMVNPNNNDGSGGFLPEELRENFEAMKSVWRQSRRAVGEEGEQLRRKEREVAKETAIAVDAEISKWQKGIAELEALLAEEESAESDEAGLVGESDEDSVREIPRDIVRFPSLPPVIPLEDDMPAPENFSECHGSLDSAAAPNTEA